MATFDGSYGSVGPVFDGVSSGGGSGSTVAAIGDLDTSDSPLALYLGADLTDSSGNGYTLTEDTGTISHPVMYGKKWLYFDECVLTNTDAAFQISGDATIFFQFIRISENTGSEFFLYCGDETGGNSIYNHQWAVWANGTTWAWTHQSGTKTGNTVGPVEPLKNGANGGPHTMCMVRTVADNTIKYYYDGNLIESDSYTNDPSGGGSTALHIGGSSAGTFLAEFMFMRNIWIKAEAKTAAQVLAMHNKAMGA